MRRPGCSSPLRSPALPPGGAGVPLLLLALALGGCEPLGTPGDGGASDGGVDGGSSSSGTDAGPAGATWSLLEVQGPLADDETLQWANPKPFAPTAGWAGSLAFRANAVDTLYSGGKVTVSWTEPPHGPLVEPGHVPFSVSAAVVTGPTPANAGLNVQVSVHAQYRAPDQSWQGDDDYLFNTGSGPGTGVSFSVDADPAANRSSASAQPFLTLRDRPGLFAATPQVRCVLRIFGNGGNNNAHAVYLYTWQRQR